MLEENQKNNKKEEIEEKISLLFIVCLAIGGGYYLFKSMDERADIRLDFERKSYIPYTINNDLFLINKYNGKTYKLEYEEVGNTYFYKYKFLAKPKTKRNKIYNKENPLDLAF